MVLLPDPTTVVFAGVITTLVAAETPLPVNITAMVLVAIVLRALLRRDEKSHEDHNRRLNDLTDEIAEVRSEASTQRHRAHLLENQITGHTAALAMLVPSAKNCSCGVMEPFVPVLEQLTQSLLEQVNNSRNRQEEKE